MDHDSRKGRRPHVLVIEDDAGVRESVCLALELEGYRVSAAETGAQGLRGLHARPDVVVLDVLLPDRSGFGVLEQIRASGSTVPVLMLTALDDVEWRVKGLRAGADDYLVKPYALSELLARLEALGRRTARAPVRLGYADLTLYPDRLQASRGERLLELTPKAFTLLRFFVENAERVLPREALMHAAWQQEVEPNTLDAQLSILRRAIGDPPLLRTVRNHGYILRQGRP